MNFGSLGHFASHEFSHLFDNQMLYYFEVGKEKKWITDTSLKIYNSKITCLLKQYSQFANVTPDQVIMLVIFPNSNQFLVGRFSENGRKFS